MGARSLTTPSPARGVRVGLGVECIELSRTAPDSGAGAEWITHIALHAGATDDAREQRDDEEDQEDEEEDLGDPGSTGGDATEAEDRGDDRDDEEDSSPVKHDSLPSLITNNLRRPGLHPGATVVNALTRGVSQPLCHL